MVPEPIKKTQRKILLECIFSSKNFFRYINVFSPTQDKPFKIGLRIKNIDSKNFPGGKITNLQIDSSEEKTIYQPFEEEFSISNLNPDESYEVWVPNAISTYLSGLIWISCNINSSEPNDEVETYQIDKNTRVIKKYKNNKWGTESYIYDKLEYEQSKTNNLILILTILTTLQGIFGLNNIFKFCLQILSTILLNIGSLIGGLIK